MYIHTYIHTYMYIPTCTVHTHTHDICQHRAVDLHTIPVSSSVKLTVYKYM